MMNNRICNFSAWWLSGLTQADGSFVVCFEKRKEGKLPYRPRPVFVLTQHISELEMIKALHTYIGVGKLRINRDAVNLVINKQDDLINIILPHFEKYPCRGGKHMSYLVFRQVVLLMQDKKHLNPEGFISILNLAYFIHGTSYRTIETKEKIRNAIKMKFPMISDDITMYKLELINNTNIPLDPNYVAGLVDGDGGFYFGFNKKRRITTNFGVIGDI